METVLRASESPLQTSTSATASIIVHSAVSTADSGLGLHHKGDEYNVELNRTDSLSPVHPPPGIVPELQNPPQAKQGPNVVGLAVCLSLVTLLFAVRWYVKFKIRKGFLVKDGE